MFTIMLLSVWHLDLPKWLIQTPEPRSGNSNFLDYSGGSVRLWFLLTHNAFLWCWGDDVAYVQVLWGQFTVQTQEITETPFYWKLISLKQRQGGLEDRL